MINVPHRIGDGMCLTLLLRCQKLLLCQVLLLLLLLLLGWLPPTANVDNLAQNLYTMLLRFRNAFKPHLPGQLVVFIIGDVIAVQSSVL